MNKLTKEQAEWLIETARLHSGSSVRHWEPVFSLDKLQTIVDKCTEKAFPECCTKANHGRIILSEGDKLNGLYLTIQNDLLEKELLICIEPKQFKQFAKGCNEIVKWLEEQE